MALSEALFYDRHILIYVQNTLGHVQQDIKPP